MSSVRNVRPFETSIRTKRLPETKYVRTKCLRAKRLRAKRLPYETSICTKRLLAISEYLHRVSQKVTNDDEGEGGITIPPKNDEVIYEHPLMCTDSVSFLLLLLQ